MLTHTEKFEQSAVRAGDLQSISATGELFNHFDGNQKMWSEEGDRSLVRRFVFRDPFILRPVICFGIIGIDSDQGRNLRYSAFSEDITPDAFSIKFATWGDTRIARVSVSWQATGQSAALFDQSKTRI